MGQVQGLHGVRVAWKSAGGAFSLAMFVWNAPGTRHCLRGCAQRVCTYLHRLADWCPHCHRGCVRCHRGWRMGGYTHTEGVFYFLHSIRLEADGGKEWGLQLVHWVRYHAMHKTRSVTVCMCLLLRNIVCLYMFSYALSIAPCLA